jgi:hypothetical protein
LYSQKHRLSRPTARNQMTHSSHRESLPRRAENSMSLRAPIRTPKS